MTIPNRDEQHGGLEAVGNVSQGIKALIRTGRNWPQLTPGEQETLDMIAHKIARILSGADPHDPEHWRDVAGYAVAARRGDGEPEAEQPVNRWRNDRPPEKEDARADGRVWVWRNDEARLDHWKNVSWWWAPGNLPAPPHPPQP